MAVLEVALVAILNGAAGVTALVGDKVFPTGGRKNPEGSYVSYQQISGEHVRSLAGASNLETPRFQFSCWAPSLKDASSLADAVRDALDGYTGVSEGVTIERIAYDNRQHLYSEGGQRAGVAVDFIIWHRRA